MNFMPPVNSGAVQILRLDRPSLADGEKPAAADIAATANGVSSHFRNAQAAASESVFSASHVDITEMKMQLIEKTGKAFGIERDDYATQSDYGKAIKAVVSQISRMENGDRVLAGIARDLGLDDLGISINTLVGAIIDPGGKDDKKLDQALREAAGENDASAGGVSVLVDDLGLYGPSS
ncbi:MAG: hypothetical protein CL534_13075 [Ahrensia sp.]|nr:hypothetical protein [Ahrensia sp.]